MAQYLADTALADLLPSSIASDPGILAAARSAQPGLSAVLAEIPKVLVYHNLEALPDAILDLVAWGWHVDGYDLVETRAERLHLVRSFYEYHRYKGTKHGLSMHLSTFLRRDLLAASPPTKSFMGAGLTPEELAAWLAPHPEVRVYPYRHQGKRQGAYMGDCLGACSPNTSDALLRIGDQVTLYDPLSGAEVPLDLLETTRDVVSRVGVSRVPVALPGNGGRGAFCGGFAARYLVDQGASSRLYVLDQTGPYTDEVDRRRALSVRPSLDPFQVGYDWRAEPGQRGRVLFLGNRWPDLYLETGGGFVGGHFMRSAAGDRLYRVTKLFDPARVAFLLREVSTFLGAFRLGALRPHHAEAAVDMARTAPAGSAFMCGYVGSRRFFVDQQAGQWIDRMRRVASMAVRYTDKIAISITNRRQVTASSGLLAGSATAGQYQLEVD